MSEELNNETLNALEDTVDVEMTEEQLGADGMEALDDEALDDVAGGAGATGTKLYLVVKACEGWSSALPGHRIIANLRRGLYLRNCRLVKVLGSGDWVNYQAFAASRNGPWTMQNGWTPAANCNLIAY